MHNGYILGEYMSTLVYVVWSSIRKKHVHFRRSSDLCYLPWFGQQHLTDLLAQQDQADGIGVDVQGPILSISVPTKAVLRETDIDNIGGNWLINISSHSDYHYQYQFPLIVMLVSLVVTDRVWNIPICLVSTPRLKITSTKPPTLF